MRRPSCAFCTSVHPRACGEHGSLRPGKRRLTGSSPRLRGTLALALARLTAERFIPAPAGNTAARPVTAYARAVHPRACGEHQGMGSGVGHLVGSSPRLRGTRDRLRQEATMARFIPAPAGNTIRRARPLSMDSVHPRACGEHRVKTGDGDADGGSSPRLRGTPGGVRARAHVRRFIPAPAGNTMRARVRISRLAVHPRACGEHPPGLALTCTGAGSSPRLRGTRRCARWKRSRPRFIPAPAGNTGRDTPR